MILVGIGISPWKTSASMDRNAVEMISVSGGIAMPSFSTAPASNAAGIVGTPGTNLILQAGTDSALGNPLFEGGLAYGNGVIGLGAGGTYTTSGAATGAYFGLGFALEKIMTKLGFSGNIGISPSSGSSFNLGLLFQPSALLNLGFTVIGLSNAGGPGELGMGLGLKFSQNVSFVVDSTFSKALSFLSVQPGLKVGNESASLMVSYGSGSGSTQLNNNAVAVGGALRFGSRLLWEIYYNKFATYYTGFAFQF